MRIAIADDSALFRRGLAALLAAHDIEVCLQAADGAELLDGLPAAHPDAAIVDIRMPPSFTDEGIGVAARVRASFPGTGVLVLSTYADADYATTLLDQGAHGLGYLVKDRVDDEGALAEALRRVAAGGSVVDPGIVAELFERRRRRALLDPLSDREREILALMAQGCSNIGLAHALVLSPKTVEKHVAAVFTKLALPATVDVNRRVRAVLAYLHSTG